MSQERFVFKAPVLQSQHVSITRLHRCPVWSTAPKAPSTKHHLRRNPPVSGAPRSVRSVQELKSPKAKPAPKRTPQRTRSAGTRAGFWSTSLGPKANACPVASRRNEAIWKGRRPSGGFFGFRSRSFRTILWMRSERT